MRSTGLSDRRRLTIGGGRLAVVIRSTRHHAEKCQQCERYTCKSGVASPWQHGARSISACVAPRTIDGVRRDVGHDNPTSRERFRVTYAYSTHWEGSTEAPKADATFSCDIAYSDRSRASSASFGSRTDSNRMTLPPRNVQR
jgi:hypothetical protein